MDYCKSILICGGDKRQKHMYREMLSDGINVKGYALGEDGMVSIENIGDFDIVVFPVPVSRDGINLNAPMVDYDINLDDVLHRINSSQIVLGGMCEKINFDMIDYYKNEKLQMYNAIPTAEGAIHIAMDNVDFTLYESKCLVLGYGRVGKMLAKMLKDIGANVTICTRNPKDVALAQVMGINGVILEKLGEIICGYDIIFNTIPKTIVNSEMLGKICKCTPIIDLASKPYGIDMAAARALGRKVIIATSLPGKYAPKTSGKILKDVIMEILVELEV